jgi:hypothetical protein
MVTPQNLGTFVRWQDAAPTDLDAAQLPDRPEPDALFAAVPGELSTASKLKDLHRDFSDYLYREQVLDLYYNAELQLYSRPAESERDFRIRAQQVARENRDEEVEKLRKKYQRKLDQLQTRLGREERELSEDQAKYEARKREELLSAGETVVGMLGVFGRRRTTGLSRAATKRRLTEQARADIEESEAEIDRLQQEIEDMRRMMQEEAEAIGERWTATVDQVETYGIKPRRQDVEVELVALAWAPYWEIGHPAASGKMSHERVPAWR